MQPDAVPDPSHCPLCGRVNQCAMEVEKATGVKQPPCWCTQVNFSAEVLEKVAVEARAQACLCEACARGMDCGSSPQ